MRRVGVLVLGVGLLLGVLCTQAGADETRKVLSGKLNLNTASKQDLQLLPGVGEVTAHRIVRFRDQIGGFKAVEDLKRVPDLGPALFTRIQDYLTLSGESNLKVVIDLNSATQAALERLPGMSKQQARAIIEYREQRAGFGRLEDLLLVNGMTVQHFEEIRELLTVLPPVEPKER